MPAPSPSGVLPRRIRPALVGALLALAAPCLGADAPPGAPAFTPLPLGAFKPGGWLKDQLRIQAEGLSGHLDEFWPDVKDSAWTGGKAEGWERAPYWLDGLVPLAVLLDDDRLKDKAKRFIDYVLEHQQADGWLGPVGDSQGHPKYDPWPLFVLFKALTQYQEATGDPRIVPALTKAMHKVDEVVTKTPLESWGHFRAADLIVSIDWLHDRTHEPWLLDLAKKVHGQGYDWRKSFAPFTFTGKTPGDKAGLKTHGVNTAMGLKWGGVWFRHSADPKDRDAIFTMLDALDKYHGQATGMFTCDEHLAGRGPSQGTELCTVVEAMYSLETLLGDVGDPRLGDRLERVAFNALPATFSPDMNAHQYDQQCNQVVCKVSPDRVYATNGPDSNLFGLEPNFGCCTANMHQGWPKFASNAWMTTPEGGLAAVAYVPGTLTTKVRGESVTITTATDYPFGNVLTFRVQAGAPSQFSLLLRVPGWAGGAGVVVSFWDDAAKTQREVQLPAEPGSFFRLDRVWDTFPVQVTLTLPSPVKLWRGDRGAVAVERGPLVYALPVGTSWKRLRGNPPYADYEVFPTTPWNYALDVDRTFPEESIRFESKGVGRRPFSPDHPPVVATVKARRVPWWTLEKNAAGPAPASPVDTDQPLETLTLVPYGCTSLRVTEFPTLHRGP